MTRPVPVAISFIRDILEEDERLIMGSRLHWIYLMYGLGWFVFMVGIGLGANWMIMRYMSGGAHDWTLQFGPFFVEAQYEIFMWMCFGAGALLFLTYYIVYVATKVLLTSKRVIYKTGLIRIRIDETDLSDVRAVHIDRGLLGQLLGYGKLRMDCRFVDDVSLPYLKDPYRMLKGINEVRHHVQEEGNVVHVVGEKTDTIKAGDIKRVNRFEDYDDLGDL